MEREFIKSLSYRQLLTLRKLIANEMKKRKEQMTKK